MALFRPDDEAFIRESGRDPIEVTRQAAALEAPRQAVEVLRPATPGDGVALLDTHENAALDAYASAAGAGRVSCFVPASGAGTRMFTSLLAVHRAGVIDLAALRAGAASGDPAAADVCVLLDDITRLGAWPALAARGCRADDARAVVAALVGEDGDRYDQWPKGLIPFHLYGGSARSAFIEHVYDAIDQARDAAGLTRLHLTVSPTHAARFEDEWARHRAAVERDTGARVALSVSEQSPRTDGIAIDAAGALVRDDEGRILFRPGGHGALLPNLAACGGDIVFVRNIDNVARREVAARALPWRQRMCGLLLTLEAGVHRAIRALRAGAPMPAVHPAVDGHWWAEPDPAWPEDRRRAHLLDQLSRPIRVCGVVPASGHVGGGPYWVRGRDGSASLQIVEGAELNVADPHVREAVGRATHFNPVDMVCALRDVDGRPFDLSAFSSQDRVIVTEKVVKGVKTRVYEHPGLWNGGMARWLTLFVEIPAFTFNPVKSLSDLLKPGHRETEDGV